MRALVLLVLRSLYQHTKFEVHSFTDSKDMIDAKLKRGHVTVTTPIRE